MSFAVSSQVNTKLKRKRRKGANLVELALVLPFILLLTFMVIEISRAWQTYESIRLATLDAAYTAAASQNANDGQTQGNNRLNLAGVTGDVQITPVLARDGSGAILGYRATGTGTYTPLFSTFWNVQIFPASFEIGFSDIYYNGVY